MMRANWCCKSERGRWEGTGDRGIVRRWALGARLETASCSLACFKKHKEVPCQKPSPLVEEPPNPLPPQRPFEVGEPSWVVDREQLQLIANSSAIQEILKDAELRRIIRQIDAADEPEDQLTNAMGGEVFRALTEKILSIVSPKE
ncbi:hypothetical protein ZIOFF_061246 [Zingiber officinale]|uniref:Uncharacterized protein n=1 Tax=Zingiber officinale TaxID=94328 RepID=A0A8J5F690_ZINOF|nr:hypothetical protein ZIOFF_061246 [Zingiber officinale]